MKIEEILGNEVILSYDDLFDCDDLINRYILFEDKKNLVGEIVSLKDNKLSIRLLGEIINNNFVFGITNKPSKNAKISLASKEYTSIINSYSEGRDSLYLGHSTIFNDLKININLTNFFNSHFSIIGGTGSGKSFALSRIVQTLFEDKEKSPYNASLFVFDTYGEYYPSFSNIEKDNPNVFFKNYTTNPSDSEELLKIHQYNIACANTTAQKGADEALTGPQDDVGKMVKEFQ